MIGAMKILAAAGVVGAMTFAAQPARAEHGERGGFSIGIGIGGGRSAAYVVPPPVYFQPTFVAPTPYYQPAPVTYYQQPTYYYQPAPTYYAPAPVYYSQPAYPSYSYYSAPVYYSSPAYCAPQPRLTFGLVGRGRW